MIDHIREYADLDGNVISKDFNILGDNCYYSYGQGCGTIWFKSIPIARKALNQDGELCGKDFVNCEKCQCHYSPLDLFNYDKFKPYLCKRFKAEYAKQFE